MTNQAIWTTRKLKRLKQAREHGRTIECNSLFNGPRDKVGWIKASAPLECLVTGMRLRVRR